MERCDLIVPLPQAFVTSLRPNEPDRDIKLTRDSVPDDKARTATWPCLPPRSSQAMQVPPDVRSAILSQSAQRALKIA
jgi:hypothetical protein